MRNGVARLSGEDQGGAEAIVRERKTGIEFQRRLKLGDRWRVLTSKVPDTSQCAVRAGIFSIQCYSAARRSNGSFPICLVRLSKAIDDLVVVRLCLRRIG